MVSSDERKAIETAGQVTGALGLGPAEVCPCLREVQRPWTDGDYREGARERTCGLVPHPPGNLETTSCGAWGAFVEHRRTTGATIAVGHGLAMSLWATATLDAVDAVDAVESGAG